MVLKTTNKIGKIKNRLAEIENQIKLDKLKQETFNENNKKIKETQERIQELCEDNDISNNGKAIGDLYKTLDERL
jgi:predicted ribonuclease toxin of YeeF-YezG toxin-antitoxin module